MLTFILILLKIKTKPSGIFVPNVRLFFFLKKTIITDKKKIRNLFHNSILKSECGESEDQRFLQADKEAAQQC